MEPRTLPVFLLSGERHGSKQTEESSSGARAHCWEGCSNLLGVGKLPGGSRSVVDLVPFGSNANS